MDAIGNHSKFIVFKITPPSPIFTRDGQIEETQRALPLPSRRSLISRIFLFNAAYEPEFLRNELQGRRRFFGD